MHKKFPFAFVAALLLLAMACKKDSPLPDVSCNSPTNDKELSKQLIIGTWRIDKSVHFFDSSFITRPPEFAKIDIKFTKEGVVEYYTAGKLSDTCTYEIDIMRKYTLFPGDTTRNVLRLKNKKNRMDALETMVSIRVCTDSLFLKYESFAYHGIGDIYLFRIK